MSSPRDPARLPAPRVVFSLLHSIFSREVFPALLLLSPLFPWARTRAALSSAATFRPLSARAFFFTCLPRAAPWWPAASSETRRVTRPNTGSSTLQVCFVFCFLFFFFFLSLTDHATAAHALQVLNGRTVFGLALQTKWATGASAGAPGVVSEAHQIYVGNLASDIDDQSLFRVFSAFKSIIEGSRYFSFIFIFLISFLH